MLTMDDTLIFPSNISFGAHGGPSWVTSITTTAGGFEYRNQANSQQLMTFNVGHAAARPELFSPLAKFYYACRARSAAFRYKDWSDFNATDMGGVSAFINLTATTWQLYKNYTAGNTTYSRKIQKVYGTTAVVMTSGSYASTDNNTGIITVSSGGVPASATFTFHVPARFDVDDAAWQIITRNVRGFIHDWQSIPLKEVRL